MRLRLRVYAYTRRVFINVIFSFPKREANVFIVDWGKGASVWNYLQVAANTRVVGAELAR